MNNIHGYQKHDSLTTRQKFLAAVLSGIITRGATQPLDVIKLRTQLYKGKQGAPKLSSVSVAVRIFREEGVRAFWAGHGLGQIYSIMATASAFYFYELITLYIGKSNFSKSTKSTFTALSGMLAGCASTSLVIPLDVIRVRQMVVKKQYSSLVQGARGVYKSGGMFAFYEGWAASMLQVGPAVGISFYVFRKIQTQYFKLMHTCDRNMCEHAPGNHSDNPTDIAVASILAGGIAGFVSKTMTYPFDLAKRRLQIASHEHTVKTTSTTKNLVKCQQLGQCLVDAYRYGGIAGLFRGWNVTITKAVLTSVITFTSYEILCYTFREFNVH